MNNETTLNQSPKTITLGGGCFWCTDAVFKRVQGVLNVEAGYANGHTPSPTYRQVCEGNTGYNEVVRITYDPQVITLRELLEIFFVIHDATTLNRQGNDVGTQYRSGIYYSDEADRAIAQEVMNEANVTLGGRMVTELLPLTNYATAETYHQDYFAKNPNQGYCAMVVGPKVKKFMQTFSNRLKHD